MRAKFLLALFIALFSISFVSAINCGLWTGKVYVNGNLADTSQLAAYNGANGKPVNYSLNTSLPFGDYFINVEDGTIASVLFKVGTLVINEGNQSCNPSHVILLDLTATDADNDGYSIIDDCNDNDNTTYPGATEICNGIDDDCDLLIDEDSNNNTLTQACYTGDPLTRNVGLCTDGVQLCIVGVWNSTCYNETLPIGEVCNSAIDEDCSGGDAPCPLELSPAGGGGGGGGGGGCSPKWTCTDWSECTSSSTQTRTCTDSNKCNKNTNKPNETQSCAYTAPVQETQPSPGSESQQPTEPITQTPGITGNAVGTGSITGAFIGTGYRAVGSTLLLLALILAILLFIAKKKKKK